MAQRTPQAPQFELLVLRLTSQPLVALPSQLPYPLLQVKPQVLDAQVRVALVRVGHDVPQPPQLFTSEPMSRSQPLEVEPSQLRQVPMHEPMLHAPEEQTGAAFA